MQVNYSPVSQTSDSRSVYSGHSRLICRSILLDCAYTHHRVHNASRKEETLNVRQAIANTWPPYLKYPNPQFNIGPRLARGTLTYKTMRGTLVWCLSLNYVGVYKALLVEPVSSCVAEWHAKQSMTKVHWHISIYIHNDSNSFEGQIV